MSSFYDEKERLLCLEVKKGGWYKIPIQNVRTKEAFIDFVYHINSKYWSDGTKIKAFIDLCDEAFKKEYGGSVRSVLRCYGGIVKSASLPDNYPML